MKSSNINITHTFSISLLQYSTRPLLFSVALPIALLRSSLSRYQVPGSFVHLLIFVAFSLLFLLFVLHSPLLHLQVLQGMTSLIKIALSFFFVVRSPSVSHRNHPYLAAFSRIQITLFYALPFASSLSNF